MSRRPVSIQDIAGAAGVSHSTVSRALNNSQLISPEVRQRIQHLAQEMGYTPNAVAQSLRGKGTNTVGVVVTSISDPFAGRIVRGIEEVAKAANVSVFLSASHNDPERELETISTFHRRRVDGVISATAQIQGPYVQRLKQINLPTVMINRQVESADDQLLSVDADDYGGARQAVDHLLNLGHRMIGYIGVTDRLQSNRRRLCGYCDSLTAGGITVQGDWVQIAAPQPGRYADDVLAGQSLFPNLQRTGVTAVFCYNDMTAVGVLMACREQGLAVPDQLSVVGYDDVEIARYVTPPLTTIHQPKLRLGALAMQMLLDILEGRPVQNQILPTDLVVRASTAQASMVTAR